MELCLQVANVVTPAFAEDDRDEFSRDAKERQRDAQISGCVLLPRPNQANMVDANEVTPATSIQDDRKISCFVKVNYMAVT